MGPSLKQLGFVFGGGREVVDTTLTWIWAKAVWRVTLKALVHRRGKEKAEMRRAERPENSLRQGRVRKRTRREVSDTTPSSEPL